MGYQTYVTFADQVLSITLSPGATPVDSSLNALPGSANPETRLHIEGTITAHVDIGSTGTEGADVWLEYTKDHTLGTPVWIEIAHVSRSGVAEGDDTDNGPWNVTMDYLQDLAKVGVRLRGAMPGAADESDGSGSTSVIRFENPDRRGITGLV